jgi:hypothetical protein
MAEVAIPNILFAATHCGIAAAASHINRVKHSFVMRRVKLKGGLCPNDSPRAIGRRSDANNAPKAACLWGIPDTHCIP